MSDAYIANRGTQFKYSAEIDEPVIRVLNTVLLKIEI